MGTETARSRPTLLALLHDSAAAAGEVPDCVYLQSEELALVQRADLPRGKQASLRFQEDDRTEGLGRGAEPRLYWDGRDASLLVEHDLDRGTEPGGGELSAAQYRLLLLDGIRQSQVRAGIHTASRSEHKVRLTYDGGPAGRPELEYQIVLRPDRLRAGDALEAYRRELLQCARRVEAGLCAVENALVRAGQAGPVHSTVDWPFVQEDVRLLEGTSASDAERGRALEDVVRHLFVTTHAFRVLPNVRTTTEEIDLALDPAVGPTSPFARWGTCLVECKATAHKTGRPAVSHLETKMRNHDSRVGVLVSWSGFTEDAQQELLRMSRQPHRMLLLSAEHLRPALDGDLSFSTVLETAYHRAGLT